MAAGSITMPAHLPESAAMSSPGPANPRLHHHFDLHRHAGRKGSHAYRRPGVLSRFAVQLYQQVGSAIGYFRRAPKIRGRVYHAEQLDDPPHLVQVSHLLLQGGQEVQHNLPGAIVTLLNSEVGPQFAQVQESSLGQAWPMARQEDQVAGTHRRDERPHRRAPDRRQLVSQVVELTLNLQPKSPFSGYPPLLPASR